MRLSTDNGRIFYGAISGVGKRGTSLDALLSEDGDSDRQNRLGESNPVAPSKWMVHVSLADSSREIPLPLSKINVDRIGAVEMIPVQKTMMGKDVMTQFDERQTGEREVRQVLRGNLLRASDKYGKEGNVVNATMAGGGVEPMLLLPRGYDLQQQLSESPVALPSARHVQQFMEVSHSRGIIKTSDEQMTLKAVPNSDSYVLQTGKKQKDAYLDHDLMAAVGDEFYSVSDRMEAVVPSDRLEDVVSYIQDGRHQRLEAVTHLDQARDLIGETIPEFSWSDSVESVIESAGLAPSVDLSNLDSIRADLETAFHQEPEERSPAESVENLNVDDPSDEVQLDELPQDGQDLSQLSVEASMPVDDPAPEEPVENLNPDDPGDEVQPDEPPAPAYELDAEGPTTIGRERVRLLEQYRHVERISNEREVEQANAIAARDDQLEVLAQQHGEDARISFRDPVEQELAQAAQERPDPGQPRVEVAMPIDDPAPEEPVKDALDPAADRDQESPSSNRIGGWNEQTGKPEKHIGKLLEEGGLSAAIMEDDEFYLNVENKPFIPLNIERHGEQLMLYHTLVENGDAFIDSEMVFNLSDDGSLSLTETAVHGPMGESRGLDRTYAGMFASNLRKQGFAEAIQQQLAPEPEPEPEPTPPEPARSPVETAPEATPQPDSSQAFSDVLGTAPENESSAPPEIPRLGNEPPESPPNYQDTLNRLRDVVHDLPAAQQENLLSAIAHVEEEMTSPSQPSPENSVPAGTFVQEAIAQADPDLDQQLTQSDAQTPASPSVEQFRDWYRAARSLGRSEESLATIEAIGTAAKAGDLNLTQADAEQMEADLSAFQHQKELGRHILHHARQVLGNLEAAGLVQRNTNGSIEAQGKQYTVRQTRQGMGVIKNDQSAGVLANPDGTITQAVNLTEADRQNWKISASRSSENLDALRPPQKSNPQTQPSSDLEL